MLKILDLGFDWKALNHPKVTRSRSHPWLNSLANFYEFRKVEGSQNEHQNMK